MIGKALACTLIVIALCVLFFGREYPIKELGDDLVAPAYGRVYRVETNGDKTTIAIVLTVMDIHAQYYPIDGEVISHVYDRNGQFNLVFDLNKSALNEKNITTMKHGDDEIVITQISGIAARRILYTDRAGKSVRKGDKLGRILLGSRVDLTFPSRWQVEVKVGDYVYGPATTIARKK
jgi:phosphatidylserine decarboxylase